MTYMIDLMRDAFRRAQAEREHLKWVKSSAEALSCNQSFFIANWAEYTPRKIVPLWNAVCLSVRIDAESKAISSEKWIRQMAPHATGATETLLKELLNRYDEALHDARKPGSDLKTVGKSHQIKLLDFLEWASKNSWALPDGFPGTLEPVARAGQLQAVPVEAAPVVEVPASKVGKAESRPGNWKMKIQVEAASRFKRLRASGASPTVHSILDDMVNWCRANDVKTDNDIYPKAGYLRTHVLGGKHWTPPR